MLVLDITMHRSLLEKISLINPLFILVLVLPAFVFMVAEISANIIIPSSFSGDWFSFIGNMIHMMRNDD